MEVVEGEVPTAAKLRKLRVVDLRKRLQSVELPQAGTLAKCLVSHLDTCSLSLVSAVSAFLAFAIPSELRDRNVGREIV